MGTAFTGIGMDGADSVVLRGAISTPRPVLRRRLGGGSLAEARLEGFFLALLDLAPAFSGAFLRLAAAFGLVVVLLLDFLEDVFAVAFLALGFAVAFFAAGLLTAAGALAASFWELGALGAAGFFVLATFLDAGGFELAPFLEAGAFFAVAAFFVLAAFFELGGPDFCAEAFFAPELEGAAFFSTGFFGVGFLPALAALFAAGFAAVAFLLAVFLVAAFLAATGIFAVGLPSTGLASAGLFVVAAGLPAAGFFVEAFLAALRLLGAAVLADLTASSASDAGLVRGAVEFADGLRARFVTLILFIR